MANSLKLERVSIPCGPLRLAGLLYVPAGEMRSTAILYCHGFTSAKHSLDGLANYLALRGFAGLAFDFAGHKMGHSEGEMLHASQILENTEAALAWLREKLQPEKVLLIGHSMGGLAALGAAALALEPVQGVITLCTGAAPSRGFQGSIGEAMLRQRSDYVAGAPAAEILTQLDELTEELAPRAGRQPTLCVAGRQDVIISPAQVEKMAAQIGPSATALTIETSHLEAPERARGYIVEWLRKQGL